PHGDRPLRLVAAGRHRSGRDRLRLARPRALRNPGHPDAGFHAGHRRHAGHRHHLSAHHARRRRPLRRVQPEGALRMTTESQIVIPARSRSARMENWGRAFYRFRQSWLSVIGLAIVLALIVIAILAPFIVPHPEHVAGGTNTAARFLPPSADAWFGTNEMGQDIFSLVLVGSQVSLFSGLAVVFIAIVVGTTIGAIAGYFGGW